MNKLDRPDVLEGPTYCIRPPTIDAKIFITINDYEVEDELRPFEMFCRSKHIESLSWVDLIMKLISAQLRQPGEFPWFVIDELNDTIDPRGGYIIPKSNGVMAKSIASHIGYILERHCEELGMKRPTKEKSK